MTVEQIVLKLVPVAAKAAITRAIAILGTGLEDVHGILEDGHAEVPDTLRETRSSWQCVVEVDFGLQPVSPGGGKRGPVLRL
jgi:hypothetical protein